MPVAEGWFTCRQRVTAPGAASRRRAAIFGRALDRDGIHPGLAEPGLTALIGEIRVAEGRITDDPVRIDHQSEIRRGRDEKPADSASRGPSALRSAAKVSAAAEVPDWSRITTM